LSPPEPPAIFQEPWQAQAFALTLHLHDSGAFSWPEWTVALSEAIALGAARGEATDGSGYYDHWLTALELLAQSRGLADSAALAQRKADWARAYRETPHGQPVELQAAAS